MSKLDDLERRVAELERHLGLVDAIPAIPSIPYVLNPRYWEPVAGCECLPGTPCGNVACPRRTRVTCVTNFAAGVN